MLKQNLLLKNKIIIIACLIFNYNHFVCYPAYGNTSKLLNDDDFSVINITSNELNIDPKTNNAFFEGNVIVELPSLKIYSEKIIVSYTKNTLNNKKLMPKKITIPTRLTVIKTDNDSQTLMSNSGVFYIPEEKIVLNGNVLLMNNDTILKTKELVYYLIKKKSSKNDK